MKLNFAPVVALALCGTASFAMAQAPSVPPSIVTTPALTPAAKALLAAEDVRFHAEETGDVAVLARMTADDLVYSHFPGMRQNKAAILQKFAHVPYASVVPSGRYARVIGTTGIVRGDVERKMGERILKDGYMAVYVRRAGQWQLLEWVTASPAK